MMILYLRENIELTKFLESLPWNKSAKFHFMPYFHFLRPYLFWKSLSCFWNIMDMRYLYVLPKRAHDMRYLKCTIKCRHVYIPMKPSSQSGQWTYPSSGEVSSHLFVISLPFPVSPPPSFPDNHLSASCHNRFVCIFLNFV